MQRGSGYMNRRMLHAAPRGPSPPAHLLVRRALRQQLLVEPCQLGPLGAHLHVKPGGSLGLPRILRGGDGGGGGWPGAQGPGVVVVGARHKWPPKARAAWACQHVGHKGMGSTQCHGGGGKGAPEPATAAAACILAAW